MHFPSILVAVAIQALLVLSQPAAPTATVDSGVIIGTTTSLPGSAETVHKYLGVPFASSPPQRFRPPQKPQTWNTSLEATVIKPACLQLFSGYSPELTDFFQEVFSNPAPEESEDCLYLNVYAPSSPPPTDGRTVMFWIYGGGYTTGHAGLPYYDGSAFAAYEDVILVAANYRTNLYGFPGAPELPLAERNLGFLDQRLALDWVQRNIRAFGGDPNKVTIFGESAGATSTELLLTTLPDNPPFRAAIMQSGAGQVTFIPQVPDEVQPSWFDLAAALNCSESSNLTCISAAPAARINEIISQYGYLFGPVADNVTLVNDVRAKRESGNFAKVPVLHGTTAEEGNSIVYGAEEVYRQLFRSTFRRRSINESAVEAAYPLGSKGLETEYNVVSAIYTDFAFTCPALLFSDLSSSAGIPTWQYYLNATFPNLRTKYNLQGAYHFIDIPLVFSTYPKANATTQQYALSNFMRGAWARFAKDPTAGPGWNAVGTAGNYSDRTSNGTAPAELRDVGALGTDGSGGVTMVRRGDIGAKCGIFRRGYIGEI